MRERLAWAYWRPLFTREGWRGFPLASWEALRVCLEVGGPFGMLIWHLDGTLDTRIAEARKKLGYDDGC